ncbi:MULTISPECIES: helix-turn-helix domain-containing protein [Burkholderia]|uniref:helix-turn-helix domain-containing protein n=1 Tax=Burkholderia TaxID=32008 RepID=UPI0015816B04|nr:MULTISPECIES: helix-turn-helix transcriptional regulator [Burkholderia]
MKQRRKPVADPKALGAELRERRKSLGKTLTEIAAITSVNVGQLSRIENGQMKRDGGNLQKLLVTLQKLEAANSPPQSQSVVERFAAIIKRSSRHAEVATAFVDALERLM